MKKIHSNGFLFLFFKNHIENKHEIKCRDFFFSGIGIVDCIKRRKRNIYVRGVIILLSITREIGDFYTLFRLDYKGAHGVSIDSNTSCPL